MSDGARVGIQGCLSFRTTQLSPCLPASDSEWMERDENTFMKTGKQDGKRGNVHETGKVSFNGVKIHRQE